MRQFPKLVDYLFSRSDINHVWVNKNGNLFWKTKNNTLWQLTTSGYLRSMDDLRANSYLSTKWIVRNKEPSAAELADKNTSYTTINRSRVTATEDSVIEYLSKKKILDRIIPYRGSVYTDRNEWNRRYGGGN